MESRLGFVLVKIVPVASGGVALFLAPLVEDVDLDDKGWVLFELWAGHQQRFCGVL